MRPLPLAVSIGDPAGVGPLVATRVAARMAAEEALVLFGDADRLEPALVALGASTVRASPAELADLPAGSVGVVHVRATDAAVVEAHRATPEGGGDQLAFLDAAIDAVVEGTARALVTGPTSKEAITASGVPFSGQTEHLARRTGCADDAVTMMFLGPRLRVALVTTHRSVRDAAEAITEARVARTVRHLGEALLRAHGGTAPVRLHVTGLNPHAGEGGLFGDEEVRVIAPALEALRRLPPVSDRRIVLVGPRPAEAVFREAAAGEVDGVVAMIHDQATIASKLLDWGEAVNVTWGLPFVRTSVDHGVAYDAAARGEADDRGMEAAVRMAGRLTGER